MFNWVPSFKPLPQLLSFEWFLYMNKTQNYYNQHKFLFFKVKNKNKNWIFFLGLYFFLEWLYKFWTARMYFSWTWTERPSWTWKSWYEKKRTFVEKIIVKKQCPYWRCFVRWGPETSQRNRSSRIGAKLDRILKW